MRRLLAALAVSAAMLIPAVPALATPANNGCPCQVTPHETMVVIHVPVGPGGMQFPYVRATVRLYVLPGYVPRGGLVQIFLQHRRTVLSRWINAGKVSFTEPWHAGWTVAKKITTPCINTHSWWRLKEQFDFIQYNGVPFSGTRYWPSKLGWRFTCLIIG